MSEGTQVERLSAIGRYAFGIVWGDGHDSILPHRAVRAACPCETCEPLPPDERPSAGDAIRPTAAEILGGQSFFVAWADGHETYIGFAELRRRCPCATCSARGEDEPSAEDAIILRLDPVGAYAVQVAWSDGHDTGIYAFEHLRRMCPCAECREAPAQ